MPDIIELDRLDLAALRELCSNLLALTKVLEQRVAALESRPVQPMPLTPYSPPYAVPMVPYCQTAQATMSGSTTLLWNGPRNPDGTPAPIKTAAAVVDLKGWTVVNAKYAAPHHVTRDLMSWSN